MSGLKSVKPLNILVVSYRKYFWWIDTLLLRKWRSSNGLLLLKTIFKPLYWIFSIFKLPIFVQNIQVIVAYKWLFIKALYKSFDFPGARFFLVLTKAWNLKLELLNNVSMWSLKVKQSSIVRHDKPALSKYDK